MYVHCWYSYLTGEYTTVKPIRLLRNVLNICRHVFYVLALTTWEVSTNLLCSGFIAIHSSQIYPLLDPHTPHTDTAYLFRHNYFQYHYDQFLRKDWTCIPDSLPVYTIVYAIIQLHCYCITDFTFQGLQQRSWIDGESLVATHVPAKQILKSTNTACVPCHLSTTHLKCYYV